MNKCMQKTDIPKWMTKGKVTLIQKDPLKGTAPKTHDMPTDDVENTNGAK